MNIAVVGGGTRCQKLIELIEGYTFYEVLPQVVAVADIQNDAPGFVKAKKNGLFVTNDYNDFFSRDDIDLIMELTGKQEVYNDILAKREKTIPVIGHLSAVFFWELARVYAVHMETTRELRETRAKYDIIINEFIHENVMVINPDYRILDVNETLLQNMGIQRQEVVGQYCYQVIHFQDAPCHGRDIQCALAETFKTQKPSKATHLRRGNDKKDRYYAVSCYPLFENGIIVGALNLSRDITRDLNVQKAMMQQEKLASIGRLSAGVAHEINNPLTTILTSSMLIQEEIDPKDPISEELKTISDEVLRCRKIVASLLDFARQTKPEKDFCNIDDIVTMSFVLTKKQAAFHDIYVELDLSGELPDICVDKDQIEQTVINLTLNAIQATGPGGKIILKTAFDSKAGLIKFSVKDTGRGIPHEHMDRIFDPFFTTTEGGTGLGLAVTHGIVEQHGGHIDVESYPGRGTCFTINLPIDPEQ